MSKRNKRGVWEVPSEEYREFMNEPINYPELILNCLPAKDQERLRKKLNDRHNGIVKREVYTEPTRIAPLASRFKAKKAPYRRKKAK